MKNEIVSIIIPVYNRSALIVKALNSVKSQTYQYWECIVVDDGSTDGSQDVVKDFLQYDSRVQLIQRYRGPKGAATCRNIGLKKASGNYVIFLDSDDYLLDHCLLTRVIEFRKCPALDFLVFQMLVLDEVANSKVFWNIDTEDDDLLRFLHFDFVWSVTSPIWKRKSLLDLGGFDEALSCWQDIDLSLRAIVEKLNYKKMLNIPPDCVNVRHNKESISQKGSSNHVQIKSKKALIEKLYHLLEERKRASLLKTPVRHTGLELYKSLDLKGGYIYLKKYHGLKVINSLECNHLLLIGLLMKLRLYYRLKKLLVKKEPLGFFCEESNYPKNFRKIKFVDQ